MAVARQLKFPNRIGYMRTKRGWTQEYVAMATGISHRHYCRIEGGHVEPGAGLLRKVARVLGCRMEDLFE